ncbi:hypothetical protein BWQ96_02633 [Gracilariopsis chorda]|uniref:NADH dehydrogenase [ubiquinone] 1 alpha subcomplex subunit 7 n=1 Tax=Gracilariopsis chorda TaxID=448386 RepID=A0A2V3IZH2_9FLOR|nr:hypothetical protein BWQ96_02633 [Gracilariopsis chorda]|eukprot:PXF47489.1 hypothetical protein BWQ96_02633 [Gracilariopsis chorda]
MALRSRTAVLLNAANKSESVMSAEGGLRAFVQRLRERLSTGKILRPDVQDDVLRQPVSESKFRYPSPGSQQPPVVPQGPYEHVFNIEYHSRDARRRHTREQVHPSDAAATAGLPPTAGTPAQSRFLGMAGDFDRHQ